MVENDSAFFVVFAILVAFVLKRRLDKTKK
jgi:hypothetical protein